MYYIFHGEDEFSRAEELKSLRAKMGDPQFADLNTTFLDGRRVSLGELRHHADAIPFLAEKRLVIVEGLVARLDPRRRKTEQEDDEGEAEGTEPELTEGLTAYLPKLPESTWLVFLEVKTLAKSNPILKFALKDKKNARVKQFSPPSEDGLADWIVNSAEQKGARIEFSAANDLALFVGPDLWALDNELEKLITYRAGEPIRREDVRALVSPLQEQIVFGLTDAMGKRDRTTALELLHDQLAHNVEPLYLMAMIIRQFRLLLQVRDLASRGLNQDQIRARLGVHPFVAKKVLEQSRHFSQEQLEIAYRKLLETDINLKTSRGEPSVNLDVLVVDLTA